MEEYLPPVVTKLKADISDLVSGLAAARLAVRQWATDVRSDLTEGMRNAGREASEAFALQLKSESVPHMRKWADDTAEAIGDESERVFSDAGRKAATSFGAAFKGMLMPLLIASIVLMSPVIVTGIAAAVTLGFGLGFTALGAMLLKENPALREAAITFKTTLAAVFKEAAAPMLGPLITSLKILTDGAKELGPLFKSVFAGVGAGLPGLATGIVGMIRELLPGLRELAPVMGQMLIALGNVLPAIGKGLGDLFSSLAKNGPAMIAFIEDAGTALGKFFTILGDVFTFFGDIYLKLREFRDLAREGGWDTPWNAVATGAEKAMQWLGRINAAWGEAFSKASTAVGNWAKRTWEDFTSWAAKVWDLITNRIPAAFSEFASRIPQAIKTAITDAFDFLFYAIGFAIVKVRQAFTEIPMIIGGAFLAARQAALEWVTRMVVSIVNWYEQMKLAIPAKLVEIHRAIVKWAEDTWNAAVAWVKRTADDIEAWWNSLPRRVGGSLNSLWATIKNWFWETSKDIYEFGKNLIQGLINGVESTIDNAIGVVRRAMDRIKQGARDALGIGSPSRVFAQYGAWTVQGYIQGLQGEQGALGRAFAGLKLPGMGGPALAASGGGAGGVGVVAASTPSPGGPVLVEAHFEIEGETIVRAITPAAQKIKGRTGTTGLD